jgi:hypothetical protein
MYSRKERRNRHKRIRNLRGNYRLGTPGKQFQFTKICSKAKQTIAFSGPLSMESGT